MFIVKNLVRVSQAARHLSKIEVLAVDWLVVERRCGRFERFSCVYLTPSISLNCCLLKVNTDPERHTKHTAKLCEKSAGFINASGNHSYHYVRHVLD